MELWIILSLCVANLAGTVVGAILLSGALRTQKETIGDLVEALIACKVEGPAGVHTLLRTRHPEESVPETKKTVSVTRPGITISHGA
jgi:hypothetical protein